MADTQVAHSINNFAIQFLKQTDSGSNAILSPVSLITALYIVHLGLQKKSQSSEELSQVLSLSDVSEPHRGLKAIYKYLESEPELGNDNNSNNNDSMTFNVANLFLSNKQAAGELKEEFKSNLERYYDITLAQFNQVDKDNSPELPDDLLLTDESRPIVFDVNDKKHIVDLVNHWASNKTNNKINELLERDMLPDIQDLAAILVNAIYLKAKWHYFDINKTRNANFFNDGDENLKKLVPFMSRYSLHVPYYSSSLDTVQYKQNADRQEQEQEIIHQTGDILGSIDFQAVELPYIDQEVSLVVLLPRKKDGLAELESAITPKKLLEIYDRLKQTKINVILPKFKFEQQYQAERILKQMGINKIFDDDEAKLTEMFVSNQRPIKVDKIVHKAVIELDENGVEAAAATAVIAPFKKMWNMAPPTLNADHPFLFVIRHVKTNASLFIGRLTQL